MLVTLRKHKVVIGRSIAKSFIPEIKPGDSEFVLAFKFNVTDNEEGVYKGKGKAKVKKTSG